MPLFVLLSRQTGLPPALHDDGGGGGGTGGVRKRYSTGGKLTPSARRVSSLAAGGGGAGVGLGPGTGAGLGYQRHQFQRSASSSSASAGRDVRLYSNHGGIGSRHGYLSMAAGGGGGGGGGDGGEGGAAMLGGDGELGEEEGRPWILNADQVR